MGELGEEIDWFFFFNFCKVNRELVNILYCGIIRIIIVRFMWIVLEFFNKSILIFFSKLCFFFFKFICIYVCEKFVLINYMILFYKKMLFICIIN